MVNSRSVLVVSNTPVGRRVCELLEMSGLGTIHLEEPSDAELREALTPDVDGIAVDRGPGGFTSIRLGLGVAQGIRTYAA